MIRYLRVASLAASLILPLVFVFPGTAAAADSGQRTLANVTVEPAVDNSTGGVVYILTPEKAPFPNKANPAASAPLYLPLYPLSSNVSAFDLNCRPDNCAHVNVLPFHFAGYDPLPASSPACVHFNGGQECSLVKGHDHLVGIASTGGDFHVSWHLQLVVFTAKAFGNGSIHNRIQTADQINALLASGDVMIVNTPVTFNGAIASKQTYDLATPVVIPFP